MNNITTTAPAVDTSITTAPVKLDPAHLEYLAKRGVSPLVIEARGYRSTTPATEDRAAYERNPAAAPLGRLGWSAKQKNSFRIVDPNTGDLVHALVLPLYAPHEDAPVNDQVRLDISRAEDPEVVKLPEDATAAQKKKVADAAAKKTPKKIKFETPAYASAGAERDETGKTDATIRGNTHHALPADVNPLAKKWLRDYLTPLLWTEGVPKADAVLSAALREGLVIVPVCFTGVQMPFRAPLSPGNPTDAHVLVEETILDLEVTGRDIYLAWDADWKTNRAVRSALLITAGLLEAEQVEDGGRVFIVNIPATDAEPKRGIDDYLAAALAAGEKAPLTDLLNNHTMTLDDAREVTRDFSADDAGRGERLAAECLRLQDALYNTEAKAWMRWDGVTWQREQGDALTHRAQQLTERDRADLDKYRQSRSKSALTAAVDLARMQPGLSVSENTFDNDPYLLNTPSGIVDLHTGELLPHTPDRRQTIVTPVAYDKSATAPTWEKFLHTTFLGDADTIRFVQRALGMALIGKVIEEKIVIMSGGGRNGKSTLTEAVTYILGQYSMPVDPEVLLGGMKDEHKANLKGRRLVVAAETGIGSALDEAAMKTLTSRDSISGRHLHQSRIDFRPSHSIFLQTNHRPRVQAQDHGTWSRIRLLPFSHTVADADIDSSLPLKLELEAPGILRWLVEGAVAFGLEGLGTCPAVDAATAEYRTSSDDLGQFLSEVCVVGPEESVVRPVLYRTYQAWAADRGTRPWTLKALTESLMERGVVDRTKPTKKGVGGSTDWVGLGLNLGSEAALRYDRTY